MANTVTTTTMSRTRHKVVLYVTVLSDGSEETGTVIYDSSVQCAAIKDNNGIAYPDSLNCKLLSVKSIVSSTTSLAYLLFDATTDVVAVPLPFTGAVDMDFRCVGGLTNYAGTGKTGDILLTTTNTNAGETIAFILEVCPCL